MAPESTTPLADFFWIAGVDGKEIEDTYRKLRDEYKANRQSAPGPTLSDTIAEDAEPDEQSLSTTLDQRPGARNSWQRLSRVSGDTRVTEPKESNSNRSSMTIRGASSPNRVSQISNGSSDFDYC